MPKQLLVVNLYTNSILESVVELKKRPQFADLEILVLTRTPEKYESVGHPEVVIRILPCDFDDEATMRQTLEPFANDIAGVICRGDKHIQYLRKILPVLPDDLCVPSVAALQASTDKKLMRQAFAAKFPEITPAHIQVSDAQPETIDMIEAAIHYPVIVKPTSLVSSMLIQSCHTRQELEVALDKVFTTIGDIYEREERLGVPEVIVEEFMEGDFYSIDTFALENGDCYYSPPVAYLPAKSMGIDDFFLYKRWIPTELSDEEIAAANDACRKALMAVELAYSVAHVELVNTKNGWKIIELGPRLGRFRQTMYAASYGIDHSMNDILVRLGQKPEIVSELIASCAAYSIYPEREGHLQEIKGLDTVEKLPTIDYFKLLSVPGQVCKFAKHGGGALLEVIIKSDDEKEFAESVNFIETSVKAVVVD